METSSGSFVILCNVSVHLDWLLASLDSMPLTCLWSFFFCFRREAQLERGVAFGGWNIIQSCILYYKECFIHMLGYNSQILILEVKT